MTVRIRGLSNQDHLADLVSAVVAYQVANPSLARNPQTPFNVGGVDYEGTYNRFTSFDIAYTVTAPVPTVVEGNISDVETSWVIDANGSKFFLVQTINDAGDITFTYYDEPGGNDVTGTQVSPVQPLSASSVVFEELERRVLLVDSLSVKDFTDVGTPSVPGTPVGIPAGAVGAICVWKPDGGDDICFVATSGTDPTPLGAGIPITDGDQYNPGRNPESPDGDPDQLTTSKFICATGKSGQFEVIFYGIA